MERFLETGRAENTHTGVYEISQRTHKHADLTDFPSVTAGRQKADVS